MKKIIFLFVLILSVSCTSKNVHKVTFHFDIEGLDKVDPVLRFSCYKFKDIEEFNTKISGQQFEKKMVTTPDGQTVEMPVMSKNMEMPTMPVALGVFISEENSGKNFTATLDLPQIELVCLIEPMSYLPLSIAGQTGEIFKPVHSMNIFINYNIKTKTFSRAETKDSVDVKKLLPTAKP